MKSLRLVPPLPLGKPGSEGVIDSRSIVWEVAREKVVALGGMAALLLQVAHPKVAAGVADHSTFRSDPLKRLIGTLEAVLVTTFGDKDQANEMASRVAAIHRPVHGMVAGEPYSALNPELALWVYATLVELALDTYSTFVRPLSWKERVDYYVESQPFAVLFRASRLPSSYEEFQSYYRNMVSELAPKVDSRSREIANTIFAARLYGIPISSVARFFAAGLLPEELRQAYGLSWTTRKSYLWRLVCRGIHFALRCLPSWLRHWRHYRVARNRLTAASN